MKKKEIKVYTKFDKKEDNYKILAIICDDVIKYIDLENNIMVIDMEKNILQRENIDYAYTFDFNKEEIEIKVKNLKKIFVKKIKTLLIQKSAKSYLVRYFLKDDDIVNEYYIKF